MKALALVAAASAASGPATGDTVAGAYLAARHAAAFSDYQKAAEYFTQALARDPNNQALLEDTLTAFVGLGDMQRAVSVARKMQADGKSSQIATMVMTVERAQKGAYGAILADFAKGDTIGPLVDGLVSAWAELGQGHMAKAQKAFDAVIGGKGTRAFGLYHKALALASVGDFNGADAIFSGAAHGPLRATRRGVIAHAQVLSQLDRDPAALELLDKTFGPASTPRLSALRAQLRAGKAVPFTMISSPADGIAEVFYTVAGALNGEAADSYTLLYSRMAEALNPHQMDAVLLSAQLLDSLQRHDLAIREYKRVPPDDPAYADAEQGRAEALRKAGKVDASIEVLGQLAKTYPDQPDVQVTLGDTLRQAKNFPGAVQAYSAAIKLYGAPAKRHWFVYYSRGISYEQAGDWPKAEADLREALALNPNQPNVLNYLGYSLVEKNENLDEALTMIKRAVAVKPRDGYILDSLGWVLYRMGRYGKAVGYMERATELEPTDAIVNDHLGDVYWAVGRQREARVQWQRALSFNPEEKDAKRIRRKLDMGLDAVLQAEGAQPLKVSANGG